jgi:gas vesicle protein
MGNYREEKTGTKSFILGAFIGGVVGAACALLFSPKSGPALRDSLKNQTAALKEKAAPLQGKVTDLAQSTKEKTKTLTETIAKQSSEAMSKLRKKNQAEQDEAQTVTLDSIQQMLEETKKAFDETEKKLNH